MRIQLSAPAKSGHKSIHECGLVVRESPDGGTTYYYAMEVRSMKIESVTLGRGGTVRSLELSGRWQECIHVLMATFASTEHLVAPLETWFEGGEFVAPSLPDEGDDPSDYPQNIKSESGTDFGFVEWTTPTKRRDIRIHDCDRDHPEVRRPGYAGVFVGFGPSGSHRAAANLLRVSGYPAIADALLRAEEEARRMEDKIAAAVHSA